MGEVGVRESLYQYLNKTNIVIPRIQRDYAQGRKNKATIRRDILSKLLSALENDNETLTLDFVYGTIEKSEDKTVLKPLDGQQRLTTLWLVHWYVSFCAGCLDDDSEVFRNFSYETRSSSREFLQAMCDEMKKVDMDDIVDSIATYIQNQSWFYNEWKYDPTIASMLRMLSGDKTGDKTCDKSCIEGVFEGKTQADFVAFRQALFFHNKVEFYILEIKDEEVPIPDRLYIKMNARGKKLSDFENFKAHFLGHVNGEIYKADVAAQKEFSNLLDGKWTDIIWDWARKGENKERFNGYIDGLFFSFINRLVLNQVMLDKSFKETNEDFVKLYGSKLNDNNPDDRLISYDGFEVYKKYIDSDFVVSLEKIMDTLDKDDNEEFREVLLPKYDKEQDKKDNYYPTSTGQAERCRILAYCIYINWKDISSIDNSRDIFKRWLYIVDNIITNSYIDTVPAMVQCIREIGNLGIFIGQNISASNNDIYSILKCYEPLNKVLINKRANDTGRQIKEEVEKAKAIWDNNVNVDVAAIETAENMAFFKGSIRFLVDEIPNPNNNGTTIWDWSRFDDRVNNAKKLFSSTDPFIPVDTYKKFITYLYEKNVNLPILCRISPNIVDTKKDNFKRQFMNDDLEDIRDFLCNPNSIVTNKRGSFYDMINSNIIDDILEGKGDKYEIKVENVDGMDICFFYKVVQNSSSYVYVDENHKKWSDELLCIINADTSARSVSATYYSNIGYFGKIINIVIDNKTYTWTKAKYENELKNSKGDKETWKETDKTVSIKDKLNKLGAGL